METRRTREEQQGVSRKLWERPQKLPSSAPGSTRSTPRTATPRSTSTGASTARGRPKSARSSTVGVSVAPVLSPRLICTHTFAIKSKKRSKSEVPPIPIEAISPRRRARSRSRSPALPVKPSSPPKKRGDATPPRRVVKKVGSPSPENRRSDQPPKSVPTPRGGRKGSPRRKRSPTPAHGAAPVKQPMTTPDPAPRPASPSVVTVEWTELEEVDPILGYVWHRRTQCIQVFPDVLMENAQCCTQLMRVQGTDGWYTLTTFKGTADLQYEKHVKNVVRGKARVAHKAQELANSYNAKRGEEDIRFGLPSLLRVKGRLAMAEMQQPALHRAEAFTLYTWEASDGELVVVPCGGEPVIHSVSGEWGEGDKGVEGIEKALGAAGRIPRMVPRHPLLPAVDPALLRRKCGTRRSIHIGDTTLHATLFLSPAMDLPPPPPPPGDTRGASVIHTGVATSLAVRAQDGQLAVLEAEDSLHYIPPDAPPSRLPIAVHAMCVDPGSSDVVWACGVTPGGEGLLVRCCTGGPLSTVPLHMVPRCMAVGGGSVYIGGDEILSVRDLSGTPIRLPAPFQLKHLCVVGDAVFGGGVDMLLKWHVTLGNTHECIILPDRLEDLVGGGSFVVTALTRGELHVYHPTTCRTLGVIRAGGRGVKLAMVPETSFVWVAHTTTISLYDIPSRHLLRTISHDYHLLALASTPSTLYVSTSGTLLAYSLGPRGPSPTFSDAPSSTSSSSSASSSSLSVPRQSTYSPPPLPRSPIQFLRHTGVVC